MNFPDVPKGFVPVQAYEHLKLENAGLRSAYEELKQKNAQLEQTIAQLLARIEDLERRLSLNSSKPPSSDGLKKPKAEPSANSLRKNPVKSQADRKATREAPFAKRQIRTMLKITFLLSAGNVVRPYRHQWQRITPHDRCLTCPNHSPW